MKIKKKFRTKLSIACSSDQLRPAMSHLAFRKGMVLATDAHILVQQKLSLHNFTEDEIKQMEGKVIHKDTFNEMYRYDVIKVIDGHFVCTKGEITAKFPLIEPDFRYPDFTSALPKDSEKEPLSSIDVSLVLMEKAGKLTLSQSGITEVKFTTPTKGIQIKAMDLTWEDELILVMPAMLMD